MSNSDITKYKGYNISIEPDDDSQNPYTDWDQLSDVNFWIRNYNLDSTGKGQQGFRGPDDVVLAFEAGEIVFYAPIRAYIHSGITISMSATTYPFNDVWDSGLAGFVYVTKEKAREEFPNLRNRALWLACERVAKAEIETLDMYLTGQVYGYWVWKKGEDKHDGESCWGYYGYDDCLSEAKGVVDQLVEAAQREADEAQAWEERVREDYFIYSCAT